MLDLSILTGFDVKFKTDKFTRFIKASLLKYSMALCDTSNAIKSVKLPMLLIVVMRLCETSNSLSAKEFPNVDAFK